jgi:hypothetical protein
VFHFAQNVTGGVSLKAAEILGFFKNETDETGGVSRFYATESAKNCDFETETENI